MGPQRLFDVEKVFSPQRNLAQILINFNQIIAVSGCFVLRLCLQDKLANPLIDAIGEYFELLIPALSWQNQWGRDDMGGYII